MKNQQTYILSQLVSFLKISLLLIVLAVFSSAKAANTNVSEETKEAASAIVDYSAEQKDVAMEKAKEMMDAMDDRIHELEGKMTENWDDMNEETREEYKASLEALREKRKDLSNWYDNMKDSSGDAWHEVKTGFAESYHGLVKHLKKAKDEMK